MKRAATLSLAAAVTMALGLGILELIFGLWLSSNPWERALTLNLVVDRTVAYDATGLYENGGPVVYTRDRYGLRGDYGDPKNITVLTVGGSTTNQRYISDGFTWQDELQRRLRAAGKPATVANAGVDGHSTFGHLASYQYWFPLIPNLRPAFTVLFVGVNDFFVEERLPDIEGSADAAPTVKSRIKANSALFRVYALLHGSVLAHLLKLDHPRMDAHTLTYTETPRLRNHDVLGRLHARGFERRFVTLLQRVREHGSIPVCVTQPSLFYRQGDGGTMLGVSFTIENVPEGPINGVDYFHLSRVQDAIMLSSCDSVEAPTIDLASDEWDNDDFYDLLHTTPRGSEKVGARIASAMKTLPW